MKLIILGSGRVGSAIAKSLIGHGHQVTVIDNDPDSLVRLGGDSFQGDFLVGDALDPDVLERAGIQHADAFMASTDDDNTNVVIAQIAQRRYHVETVVVRLFDPDKAAFYQERGLQVVCPTLRSIGEMIEAVDRSPAAVHDHAPGVAHTHDEFGVR